MKKQLCKSTTDVKVDGVCTGVAKYIGIDVTLVRLIWVVLLFQGIGLVAYIACAIIMPRETTVAAAPHGTPGIDYIDMTQQNGQNISQ